jgi:hypothetical protein
MGGVEGLAPAPVAAHPALWVPVPGAFPLLPCILFAGLFDGLLRFGEELFLIFGERAFLFLAKELNRDVEELPNLRKRLSLSFSSPARTARESTCTSSSRSAFFCEREPIFFLSFSFSFSSSATRMRNRVISSSFVMGELYRIMQT